MKPRYDLLILDLDLTVWDHEDASSLVPPYQRVSEGAAADSRGTTIRLRPGVRELLSRCAEWGIRVTVASWNRPDVVFPLLRTLDLDRFLWNPVIEFHPDKVAMVAKILRALGPEWDGRGLFVDDREENVRAVAEAFERVDAVRFGVDVKSFRDLAELLVGGREV